MNQFFLGGAALILAISMWGLGKSPKTLFGNYSKKNLNFLARRELVLHPHKGNLGWNGSSDASLREWHAPKTTKDKVDLRKKLIKWISLGPEERMKAVLIASQWKDKSSLTILKRGLRDSDCGIVFCAAQAIDKYRSLSVSSNPYETSRPPRNVFLMR